MSPLASLQATYAYDALGRRIKEISGGQTRELYYSSDWQVIEERVPNSATPSVMVPQVQYVWSPVYIDAMIERDRDTDADGSLNERVYVLTDANFNVTALVGLSGGVFERYQYDPYGKVTVLTPGAMPYGWSGDWDGWVATSTSVYGWKYYHQGGRQDTATGLLNFRNRDYSTSLMRWTTNDPIGFGGGDTNTYRYVGNGPGNALDPSGLEATNKAVYDELGDLPAPNRNGERIDLVPLKQDMLDMWHPQWWATIGGELKDYGYQTFVAPMVRTGEFAEDVVLCWDITREIKNPYLAKYLKGEAGYLETWFSITSDAVQTVTQVEGAVTKVGSLVPKTKPSVPTGNVSTKGGAKPSTNGSPTNKPSNNICDELKRCFFAGTLVSTSSGLKAIETLQNQDEVWAFDVTNNQWNLKRVIKLIEDKHEGVAVWIGVAGETIKTTDLHPFWVVNGEDLAERVGRKHFQASPEDAGVNGQGFQCASCFVSYKLKAS